MKQDIYAAFVEACRSLTDGFGGFPVEIVAPTNFRMPACDQILPPFVSLAANAWRLDAEVRDELVAKEYEEYKRECAEMLARDPIGMFGLPFRRDPQLQGGNLAVVDGSGNVRRFAATDF